MFKAGDKLYVIDNGAWNHQKKIKILERDFIRYNDVNCTSLTFGGETSLTIPVWAVSASLAEATKFAVTYMIKVHELGESITDMNIEKEYSTIEKLYPDLIFKYMDKVVEAI